MVEAGLSGPVRLRARRSPREESFQRLDAGSEIDVRQIIGARVPPGRVADLVSFWV